MIGRGRSSRQPRRLSKRYGGSKIFPPLSGGRRLADMGSDRVLSRLTFTPALEGNLS
jgi:hypothetical protein